MYTGQEIFDNSISILDELSENGNVDAAQVKEYSDRAPYLLDMWQKKIARLGDLYYISEYLNDDGEGLNKWTRYEMPANAKSIKEVLFIGDNSQISTMQYKQFGRTDLYLYFAKTGTARVLYAPIPLKITSLKQSLEVDDMIAQSGAYYLAEHFAISDQNDDLARKCSSEFKSLMSDIGTVALGTITEIKDSYGGWYE